MRLQLSICCAIVFLASQPAVAESERDKAAALADCAWNVVPQTASVLAELRPRRRVVYDAPDAPQAAPFMRVYAACSNEYEALSNATESGSQAYLMLRAIRRNEPDEVLQDTFSTPVFRCEANFADATDQLGPARIWWGYGEDRSASQLGAKSMIFNSQITITTADLAALEKRGDGVQNMLDLLERTENQDVLQFEGYQEGMASEKAFEIMPSEANTTCQIVTPQGGLRDA